MSDDIHKLWAEMYRPSTIAECILKSSIRTDLMQSVNDRYIQNSLFFGPPGTGKTTAAKALCRELGVEWMVINASEERGIDVLRDKVYTFASTAGLMSDGQKCVILDEADYLTQHTQAAFRNSLEQFEGHCSFIFTANFPNKIIEPLQSRLASLDFGIDPKEADMMQAGVFTRVCDILEKEGVEYDESVVAAAVQMTFPDIRSLLVRMQQAARSNGNKVDAGLLMSLENATFKGLAIALREKKMKKVLQWCADNSLKDTSAIYQEIYENIVDGGFVEKTSIPDAISIIGDAQRYDSIVPSKELHLAQMCVELMTTVEFN